VNRTLTSADIDGVTGQLRAQFDHGPVTLAPLAGDWASMTSGLHAVTSSLPAAGGLEVKMEVSYRQPLASHVRLVSGSLSPGSGTDRAVSSGYTPDLSVVVTQEPAGTRSTAV
jgi:hypothetical protein